MVVVIVMLVVVMVVAEEFRLDLQGAVEIEGVAPKRLRQRNAAALGPVRLGIRIDAADARPHLAKLVGAHQWVQAMPARS
jgi:hypothetical protein